MLKDLKKHWKSDEIVNLQRNKRKICKKVYKNLVKMNCWKWHFNSLIVTKKKTEQLWKSVSLNVPYFCRIDSGQFGQGTEKKPITFEKKCNTKHFGLVFKIQWQVLVTLPLIWISCQNIGSTKLSKIGENKVLHLNQIWSELNLKGKRKKFNWIC